VRRYQRFTIGQRNTVSDVLRPLVIASLPTVKEAVETDVAQGLSFNEGFASGG
jgi:hypothetical protein